MKILIHLLILVGVDFKVSMMDLHGETYKLTIWVKFSFIYIFKRCRRGFYPDTYKLSIGYRWPRTFPNPYFFLLSRRPRCYIRYYIILLLNKYIHIYTNTQYIRFHFCFIFADNKLLTY